MIGKKYTIFGYKGKQVGDQIHSSDVISLFNCFINNPKKGEVYNLGGGKQNSASVLEVIDIIQNLSGRALDFEYSDNARKGDHICYYSNLNKIKSHFPEYDIRYSIESIIEEMVCRERNEK